MKQTFGFLFFVTLLMLVSGIETRADLAKPPDPATKKGKVVFHSGLTIEPDSNTYEAKLQMSPETLGRLRAALNNLPADDSTAQAITQNPTRTVMAGFSLFLALSFGGVWLVRSGSTRGQKVLAAVLIGAAVLGAAAIITRANAGPPPAYRWRNLTQNLNEGRATSGGVDIEVVPDASGIKLILPLTPAPKPEPRPGE
jgi:hypothetical protein